MISVNLFADDTTVNLFVKVSEEITRKISYVQSNINAWFLKNNPAL